MAVVVAGTVRAQPSEGSAPGPDPPPRLCSEGSRTDRAGDGSQRAAGPGPPGAPCPPSSRGSAVCPVAGLPVCEAPTAECLGHAHWPHGVRVPTDCPWTCPQALAGRPAGLPVRSAVLGPSPCHGRDGARAPGLHVLPAHSPPAPAASRRVAGEAWLFFGFSLRISPSTAEEGFPDKSRGQACSRSPHCAANEPRGLPGWLHGMGAGASCPSRSQTSQRRPDPGRTWGASHVLLLLQPHSLPLHLPEVGEETGSGRFPSSNPGLWFR